MDLIEQYKMKGHCLFIDNFYTSPKLLHDLLVAQTYCTGTIQSNRKNFPKELVPSGMNVVPGNFWFATTILSNEGGVLGEMVAVWWRNHRDVLVLSTMHNTSTTTVLKRSKGGHEKQPLACPTIIEDYNLFMGGVDLTDQHLSYYSLTTRKTLNWWIKGFWRLVDISIINSWIIFHKNNPLSDSKVVPSKAN